MEKIASIGTWGNQVSFDPTDPADEKRAWMEAFGTTSERYDEIKAQSKSLVDSINERFPLLHNLMWVDGEMYYVDEQGNRTDKEVPVNEVTKEITSALLNNDDSKDKFCEMNNQYLHYVDLEDFEGDDD